MVGSKTTLLKTSGIGRAVRSCSPGYVAVAYIGKDWDKLIDKSKLKKIILSPTIGSNPSAIAELAECVSWEKVLFLEELHAKIYIGKNCAVLGSANLSKNGLCVSGLEEAAVMIKDRALITQVTEYFQEIEKLALQQFPNISGRKKRLSHLKRERARAIANEVIVNDEVFSTDLQNYYPLSGDDFYIVWYQSSDDYEYTNAVKEVTEVIEDDMHFHEDDQVEDGKWILSWKITDANKPDRRVKPHWMFIHEIFSGGVRNTDKEEYEYTKLAVMRKDKETPNPPFEITDAVVRAFNEIICSDKYCDYFVGKEEPFFVKNTFGVFEEFIRDLKSKA